VQTEIDPRDLIGHKAVDRNGDKIGTIDEVYLDDATGEPEWAAVRTGLFGRDAFVPLTTSEFVSDELRVPYEKSQVKDSPDFGAGQHLSPAQELQLYRYYGLELPAGDARGNGSGSGSGSGSGNGSGTGTGANTGTGTAAAAPAAGAGAAVPAAAVTAAAAATAAASAGSKPAPAPIAESTQPMPVVDAPPATPSSRTAAFMTSPQPAQQLQPPQAQPLQAQPLPTAQAQPRVQTPPTPPVTITRPVPDPLTDPLPGQATGTTAAGTSVPEPIEFVCREERLDITTEWSVLGHARLRKYVTTEQVERRVPVIRERIRVERVPVGADEREQLTDQEISESTEEVTLHEERVVVRKAVVPVERIRLVTERFTEEQIVRDELHREHIQVQDSTRLAGPTAVPGNGGPGMGGPGVGGPGVGGAPQQAPGSAPGSAPGAAPGSAPAGRPEPFPRSGDTGHAIGA